MNGTINGYKLTRQLTASTISGRGSGVVFPSQGEVLVSAVTDAGETIPQATPTPAQNVAPQGNTATYASMQSNNGGTT